MSFANPNAFWCLLALPLFLLGLSWWGWRTQKDVVKIFLLNVKHLKKRQVEKYILAASLLTLLIVAMALPEIVLSSTPASTSTGEIILLVDTTGSMAAQENVNTPNRLARIKTMLYEILDDMEGLGQVKLSLYGFSNKAMSLVPFVGKDDYVYLKESIDKVLDVNSVPGHNTSLGQSILDVLHKFSENEQGKLIILFSDGEPFLGLKRGMSDYESDLIKQATDEATVKDVKIITVGVGETNGAKIPIFDDNGVFTGEFAKLRGDDYISYLETDILHEIASNTGGKYFFENDRAELKDLIKDNLVPSVVEGTVADIKEYQSIAYWFVLLSLPIWIVFVRRHLLK
jgi:uncharacterized protein YegL